MYKESQQFENEQVLERVKEKYLNSSLPLKIAKTELLRDLGLPTPETDYFSKDEISALKTRILQRLPLEEKPLIVRVACVPDRFSMPTFFVEDAKDIDQIIEQMGHLVTSESTVTHFILQNATPKSRVKNKIVGRLLYTGQQSLPLAKIVELYKGAKSADVLDRVKGEDPNYERLEQRLGEFTKPISKSTIIDQAETRNIYSILNNYEPQLELAKKIFASGRNKAGDETSASFEFSYRDGNLVFVDID